MHFIFVIINEILLTKRSNNHLDDKDIRSKKILKKGVDLFDDEEFIPRENGLISTECTALLSNHQNDSFMVNAITDALDKTNKINRNGYQPCLEETPIKLAENRKDAISDKNDVEDLIFLQQEEEDFLVNEVVYNNQIDITFPFEDQLFTFEKLSSSSEENGLNNLELTKTTDIKNPETNVIRLKSLFLNNEAHKNNDEELTNTTLDDMESNDKKLPKPHIKETCLAKIEKSYLVKF
ncbi:hypothetical protein TUBRATIS_22070 [Tubulinosema ratisbonensis]|uniref:Uncharacterized protein n=1 Tax=Tubulinosema ratisbonensis TaxID=291195 RepID=A0A437AJL5_9MICR|nr:hypothetical protein TUBRATIS_22070 [Tubulinosema ratisbonensis]